MVCCRINALALFMVEFVLVRFLDVEYNMVAVVKYFFDIWRPSLYVNFFFGI
jgi:hypothetical protein